MVKREIMISSEISTSLVGGYLLNTISIPVVEASSFKIPYLTLSEESTATWNSPSSQDS
jgi:hypothetical protein